MKSLRFLLSVTLLMCCFQLGLAQNGIIRGKVIDKETAEPLIGATVRVLNQDSAMVGGAYTDVDGKFNVENLAPGMYTLVFTYISYADLSLAEVEVKAGEVTYNEVVMGLDEEDLGEENTVVLTAKVNRQSEVALLTVKRKATNLVDVIAYEQVKRAGDSDAASAMRRVTGVTVEGGKYVYVRGLGDRYSRTTLNGAEIPGLDPDRNSVQMDMFPSNLIDNIVVYKTFTPDLPANFSGGLVQVSTKDFPEKFTFQWSSSTGFNTQSSFRDDFITYETGGLDFLATDDGTREVPSELQTIPNISFSNQAVADELTQDSRAFDTNIFPDFNGTSILNHSHSISVGDQKSLGGKPFGYIASITYSHNNSYYNDGNAARWKLTTNVDSTDVLNKLLDFQDTRGWKEVLWGGLINLSYKPGQNHKLAFNYLHNQSGQTSARYLTGGLPDDDPNLIFETRALTYLERSLDAFQLKGSHNFPNVLNMKADWIASYTRSSQDEPDIRFFSNDYTINAAGDTLFDLQPNLYNPPSRYFRTMEEDNVNAKLDLQIPFALWNGLNAKVQFGGYFTLRDRRFVERRFEYQLGSNVAAYNGNPAEFWSDNNLGQIGVDQNGAFLYGLYITDASQLRNSYNGTQTIGAGYALVDLPITNQLRAIAGGRYERTDLEVTSRDNSLDPGLLDLNDFLPSVSLIWSPQSLMNVRLGYARTLARPTFRELAPYASFEFVRDVVLVGNDTLKRTLIDNLDLRWEWFPTPRELVSASVFFKQFQNPIEQVINPIAQNIELNYRNVDQATIYGLELEFRKSLDFIASALKDFRAGLNLTLIQSFLDINPQELQLIRALDPNADSRRPMFGQSPYTVNAELAYLNDTLGLTANVNFNVFGPRISAISTGGTPNVFEQPRPSLDFSVSQRFASRWSIRFRAQNLLNPEYKQTHTFKDTEFIFQTYRVGRTFSLGISYSIK